MVRKYDQQHGDARERIRNHSTEGMYQVQKGVERTHPGYEDVEDAERILMMADAYDVDNLVVDRPEGQSTKPVMTLKNYPTDLNKIALYVALMDTTAMKLNTMM